MVEPDDLERLKRHALEGDSDAQDRLLEWAVRSGAKEWIQIVELLRDYKIRWRREELDALRKERLAVRYVRTESAFRLKQAEDTLPVFRMGFRIFNLFSLLIGGLVTAFINILFLEWSDRAIMFAYAILCLGSLWAYRQDVKKIMKGRQYLEEALERAHENGDGS